MKGLAKGWFGYFMAIFLFSVVLVMGLELYASLKLDHKMSLYFERINLFVLVNALGVSLLIFSLIAITNQLFVSLLLGSGLYFVLIDTHIKKVEAMNLPLYFIDSEILYQETMSWLILLMFLFIVGYILSSQFEVLVNKRSRFILPLVLGGLLFAGYQFTSINPLKEKSAEVWHKKGILYSYIISAKTIKKPLPPEKYRYLSMQEMALKYEKANFGRKLASIDEDVNIVVFLVDGLVDLSPYGIKSNKEPMQYLKYLQKRYPSGDVIIPSNNKNGLDTEFEVLTGFPFNQLYPVNSNPYVSYFHRNTYGLASFFKAQGFKTKYIGFSDDEFRDKNVYSFLGFDEAKIDQIQNLDNFEIGNKNGKGSTFTVVHVDLLSFQKLSSSREGYLSARGLGQKEDREVSDLLNASKSFDNEIKGLIQKLQNKKERFLVFISGSSQPDVEVISAGQATDYESKKMKYSVPFFSWANFEIGKEQTKMSSNFVSSFLFTKLNLDRELENTPFLYINEFYKSFDVVSHYVQDKDGNVYFTSALPRKYRRLIEDYQLLKYDILVGDEYVLNR